MLLGEWGKNGSLDLGHGSLQWFIIYLQSFVVIHVIQYYQTTSTTKKTGIAGILFHCIVSI